MSSARAVAVLSSVHAANHQPHVRSILRASCSFPGRTGFPAAASPLPANSTRFNPTCLESPIRFTATAFPRLTTRLSWRWPSILAVDLRHRRHDRAHVHPVRLPLAGSGVVTVVAPRTDETDLSILPSPYVPARLPARGSVGCTATERRFWFSLNRFPVQPPGADFALLTSAETQRFALRNSV